MTLETLLHLSVLQLSLPHYLPRRIIMRIDPVNICKMHTRGLRYSKSSTPVSFHVRSWHFHAAVSLSRWFLCALFPSTKTLPKPEEKGSHCVSCCARCHAPITAPRPTYLDPHSRPLRQPHRPLHTPSATSRLCTGCSPHRAPSPGLPPPLLLCSGLFASDPVPSLPVPLALLS